MGGRAMTTLALWLLPIAALACWRWSRLVAGALAFAFGAALLYRYAWQWEGLRWVSAATGLVGTFELGRVQGWRDIREHVRAAPQYGAELRLTPRRDVLALLLVGSSAADAAAVLWWRGTGEWGPLPFFQVVVLAAMIAIGLWPRGRT